MMTLRDAAPGALMIVLAGLVLAGTWSLTAWDGFTPGPGFFPRIVATAGFALGVADLIVSRGGSSDPAAGLDGGGWWRVGSTIFALAAVAVLTPALGMSPAIGLFTLFMLTAGLRRPLVASLATAVGVAVALELIFVSWLGVPLPRPFFL
jgi:hypothetical protein